jgi:hypothetical protein
MRKSPLNTRKKFIILATAMSLVATAIMGMATAVIIHEGFGDPDDASYGRMLELGRLTSEFGSEQAIYYTANCIEGRVWMSYRGSLPDGYARSFFDNPVPRVVGGIHQRCEDFTTVEESQEVYARASG